MITPNSPLCKKPYLKITEYPLDLGGGKPSLEFVELTKKELEQDKEMHLHFYKGTPRYFLLKEVKLL